AEGASDDPAVNALRARQSRNLLATLLLSQGIPMLLAGDDIGRTQGENNNAYCQDNEISWLHWDRADWALNEFTKSLIRFRRRHPVFRRRRFFLGRPIHGAEVRDIVRYRPDGAEMSDEDWASGFAQVARRAPERQRAAGARRARGDRGRRHVLPHVQRALRAADVPASAR